MQKYKEIDFSSKERYNTVSKSLSHNKEIKSSTSFFIDNMITKYEATSRLIIKNKFKSLINHITKNDNIENTIINHSRNFYTLIIESALMIKERNL